LLLLFIALNISINAQSKLYTQEKIIKINSTETLALANDVTDPKATTLYVNTYDDFDNLRNYTNRTDVVVYIESDIDMTSFYGNWTPIGTKISPFMGIIYGQFHTLSNLTISGGNNVGLFAYFGGVIGNIHLENVNITGNDNVGGFCAKTYGPFATLHNVTVDGVINGNSNVGGICGYAKPYYMLYCYSDVEMNVTGNSVGGIVGKLDVNLNSPYYEIKYSYSFGTISTTNNSLYIGGVVGLVKNAYLHQNYSNMSIQGKNHVGSVVGKFIRNKDGNYYGTCYYGIGSGEIVDNIATSSKYNFAKIIGNTDDKTYFETDNSCYSRTDMKYQKNGVVQSAFPERSNNYNGISQSPDKFDEAFFTSIGWNLQLAEDVLGTDLYSIFLDPPKDTEWDGEINNTWSNGGNWTNGVPNINSNVVIPNLEKAEVEVEVVAHDACKSLTIGESVSIVVKPGGTLNVTGTIANNSPQTSEFVLQSDATGTGSLIHKSGAITVRYEQYIPANGAMIGSPVDLPTNTHFSDIKTVSGQSNMGIDVMNDMFMSWDENEVINGYTGIWTDLLTPVNGVYPMNTQSFEQGKGLFISYRNRTETIVYEGVARAENENVSTTYTSSSSNPGANFISNPFVATVASNNQANNSHNFLKDNISHLQDDAAALYIWDPQTSTYSVVNNISGGEYLLNPGQSFLVMTKENADLSFKQNTRMVATSGKSKDLNESRISIAINNTLDNSDVTDIYFSENMTVGVDKGYDAEKMMNEHVNIFTNLPEANEERFAVLALPTSYNALTIPVQMDVFESGRHTLTFSIDNVNANSIYFKDNETGEMTNLNLVSEVKVDLEAGLTEGRFELFIKERVSIFSSLAQEGNNLKGTITNINQDVLISLDEIIDGDVVVYNLSGQTVYSEKINGEQNKTFNTNLSRGYYVVKVQNNQGKILTEKVFIK